MSDFMSMNKVCVRVSGAHKRSSIFVKETLNPLSRSYGFAISISRRFLRSFGSFSGFGRCGDSSSLTSQSFRASHGKGTCFTGIDSRVFFQNLLASFIKCDIISAVLVLLACGNSSVCWMDFNFHFDSVICSSKILQKVMMWMQFSIKLDNLEPLEVLWRILINLQVEEALLELVEYYSPTMVMGRNPANGDVLIIAHRRGKHTETQYLTWFGKLPTSMGEASMTAPLAPLSSMVAAKLISSSTKIAAKVKVGGCHQQASFFDNVNIIGNIPTITPFAIYVGNCHLASSAHAFWSVLKWAPFMALTPSLRRLRFDQNNSGLINGSDSISDPVARRISYTRSYPSARLPLSSNSARLQLSSNSARLAADDMAGGSHYADMLVDWPMACCCSGQLIRVKKTRGARLSAWADTLPESDGECGHVRRPILMPFSPVASYRPPLHSGMASMTAPLAPLSSMVAAKLISSSTKMAAKVKVGGCHQQASFFDNVNIIDNIPTDGPLRRLDDPENASFLEELEPADRRSSVHDNLTRRDQNCPESVFLLAVFVFRKVVSGKSLSKLSCVCLPVGKLADGTRMVAHFNNSRTVNDIGSSIDASRPGGARNYQLQLMGFPPKLLTYPTLRK
ncbi:hypothetical protein NC652_010120 [Populus alba x Populus x berolinensis]|nr:hypothetical protein NC652_010120 [Populus alba x Populus x berolinensis]